MAIKEKLSHHLHNPSYISLIVVLAGVTFRLRQFSINRSLWLDEAALANNVVTHSWSFLLTHTLTTDQTAPGGFLLLLKLSGKLSGYRDIILRIVPLCFGLAALPMAVKLKNRFKTPLAQYLFIGLIASSPILIYYSSEVKQYIVDVFFLIYLIWVGLSFQKWKYGYVILAFSGVVAIFTSSPSVFILFAVGTFATLQSYQRRDWQSIKKLTVVGFSWILLFGLLYWIIYRNVLQGSSLTSMWNNSFAPLPNSLAHINWYLDSFLGLTYIGFSPPSPVPMGILASWFTLSNILIFIGFILGGFAFYRQDRDWLILNLLIIASTLIASFFHLYPFQSRPILFLIPIIFSFLCTFIDYLGSIKSPIINLTRIITSILLLGLVFTPASNLFLHPIDQENIKAALNFVVNHKESGDHISISIWDEQAIQFYSRFYAIKDLKQSAPVSYDFNPNVYIDDICNGQLFGRTWVIFAHRFFQRNNLLPLIEAKTPLLLSWESTSSGVYLFNFDRDTLCQR